jgi:hypothetical protein
MARDYPRSNASATKSATDQAQGRRTQDARQRDSLPGAIRCAVSHGPSQVWPPRNFPSLPISRIERPSFPGTVIRTTPFDSSAQHCPSLSTCPVVF